MLKKSLILIIITFCLLISGCISNDKNDENINDDISIEHISSFIELTLKTYPNNNSTLLIPTLITNNSDLLTIESLKINGYIYYPKIESSIFGYVINISENIRNNLISKFYVDIEYNYTNNNKYSKFDVIDSKTSQFFMNTSGLSTWSENQIWVFSIGLEGRIRLMLTRHSGEYVLCDEILKNSIIHEGWHGYEFKRYYEDIIG